MRNKNEIKLQPSLQMLTPWDVEEDQTSINTYCSNLMQMHTHRTVKMPMNLPNLHLKRRAITHCGNVRNENVPLTEDKVKFNKLHQDCMNDRAFTTVTHNRTERFEKRREQAQRMPLLELKQLSVKNFFIEGQQKSHIRDRSKKKESSYILKQKYIQFRRSLKSISQSKQNINSKVLRYE